VLNATLPHLPAAVLSFLPENTEPTSTSYYALSAGLLSDLAAVLTGAVAASRIVAKQGGAWEADKKTVKPKFKTVFTHSVLNYLVLLISAGY
jgi:hypothetical protein